MNIKRYAYVFVVLLLCVMSSSLQSMTYDNRHFPLLDKPILRQPDTRFFIRAQPIVMFANSSFGFDESDEDTIGLFEIEGPLEQNDWDNVLLKAGIIKKPLLRPDLATSNILWGQRGKLEAGGAAFRWYYGLSGNWEVGGSLLVLGARSQLESVLRASNAQNLTDGDVRDLQTSFNEQRKASNLGGFLWSKAGFGDLDLYLRYGARRDYILLMKSIDTGIRLGMIAPTGVKRELNNPASVPFGGNGHWGTYVDMALHAELREDISAGLRFRFIQRFAKTQEMRLPIRSAADEPRTVKPAAAHTTNLDANTRTDAAVQDYQSYLVPLTFSPVVGTTRVSPGFTFVFAPYVNFADYRDGFGAQFGYNLTMHTKDSFSNIRSRESLPVDRGLLQDRSSWASEYASFSLSYDFAHNKDCRGSTPMLYLDVDVPVKFVASKRSNKTFGISLRIESDLC